MIKNSFSVDFMEYNGKMIKSQGNEYISHKCGIIKSSDEFNIETIYRQSIPLKSPESIEGHPDKVTTETFNVMHI